MESQPSFWTSPYIFAKSHIQIEKNKYLWNFNLKIFQSLRYCAHFKNGIEISAISVAKNLFLNKILNFLSYSTKENPSLNTWGNWNSRKSQKSIDQLKHPILSFNEYARYTLLYILKANNLIPMNNLNLRVFHSSSSLSYKVFFFCVCVTTSFKDFSMNVSETNVEYITLINLDTNHYSIYNLIFIFSLTLLILS